MRALPVDEEFVDTVKARAVAEREMAVSAEQLFATLEDRPSWSKWVPLSEVTWTSPKPFTTASALTSCIGLGSPIAAWAFRSPPRTWAELMRWPRTTTSYPCPPNAAPCAGRWRCRFGARRARPSPFSPACCQPCSGSCSRNSSASPANARCAHSPPTIYRGVRA